jgi:hypothetical protein
MSEVHGHIGRWASEADTHNLLGMITQMETVTSFESINNGTSRKTELKNFYFIYQPPDLIEQRGKTALININQIQVCLFVCFVCLMTSI